MMYQVITGQLKARTAVHIGSGEGNDVADALLRRNVAGVPLIPGTAIAGALRTLLTRLAPRLDGTVCQNLSDSQASCSCGVCQLMGDVNPTDEGEGESHASRLLVFNAELAQSQRPFIRDGVGIDRVARAAARQAAAKFDLEILPADTIFDLRLELRNTTERDESLLAAALAEWQAGHLWLGGNVARGLGAFTLDNLKVIQCDLDQKKQLMTFLKSPRPWQDAQDNVVDNWLEDHLSTIKIMPLEEGKNVVARCWIAFTGTLQAEGPLLTNDSAQAGLTGFDHAPLLKTWGNWKEPVLSGAGMRGVLRSHAERIARTLATLQNPDVDEEPEKAETWFLTHCPACDPNARRPGRNVPLNQLPPLESCDSLLLHEVGKSGNDPVERDMLCLGCRLFGSTRWGSRLLVEDAPYNGKGSPVYKMRDFVAIDRFTGGGADRFKFDALALWQPSFQLQLRLENPEPWELGWLALALRDLIDGWLAVGYGVSKGFGRVKCNDLKIRYGYLHADDVPEQITSLPVKKEGVYSVTEDNFSSEIWQTLFGEWVSAFRQKVAGAGGQGFERNAKMALPQDSYFRQVNGQWIHKLYPREVKL